MRSRIGSIGFAILVVAGAAGSATPAAAASHKTTTNATRLFSTSQPAAARGFNALVDLQGLYDEISQADAPYLTDTDLDLFYKVVYTLDWVFVDTGGRRQPLGEMREQATKTGVGPEDSMIQRVVQLSLVPDGATTVVEVTTFRPVVVDAAGRYGRPGASHTITETISYRDSWVSGPDGWKMKSREQLKPSRVEVDKPEWRS
jgi:hypothetical protein